MTDWEIFAEKSFALAERLEVLSRKYHIKSDDHDILRYEAESIREKTLAKAENRTARSHLMISTILSEWGRSTALKESEIAEEARSFHRDIESYEKT